MFNIISIIQVTCGRCTCYRKIHLAWATWKSRYKYYLSLTTKHDSAFKCYTMIRYSYLVYKWTLGVHSIIAFQILCMRNFINFSFSRKWGKKFLDWHALNILTIIMHSVTCNFTFLHCQNRIIKFLSWEI